MIAWRGALSACRGRPLMYCWWRRRSWLCTLVHLSHSRSLQRRTHDLRRVVAATDATLLLEMDAVAHAVFVS
jgi:DhnA family fructose-bisphosphate aldolase class Ia